MKSKQTVILLSINGIFAALLLLLQKNLPPVIPLFYGEPTGMAQLAAKQAIFLPTIFTSVIVLINLVISTKVKDSLIRNALTWSSYLVTFLSIYTTVRILLLVGNF